MKKRMGTLGLIMTIGFAQPNLDIFNITNTPEDVVESKSEIENTMKRMENIIMDVKKEEMNELNQLKRKHKGSDAQSDILEQIKQIEDLNSLEDFAKYNDIAMRTSKKGITLATVGDVEIYLKERGYTYNQNFADICLDIEKYRNRNAKADCVEIVEYINESQTEETFTEKLFSGMKAEAYTNVTYEQWTSLTTSEKLLIASDPKAALIAQSCAEEAFAWTKSKFGYNGLGDKSDAYRHGSWNALMTRDISRAWAKSYATAHEDKTDAELAGKESDGYKKTAHRDMDLHNNEIGRDCVKWYEISLNCSDSTVKERVSKKLTNNKNTGLYWIHS